MFEEDEEEEIDEAELLHEGLRAHFPASFGTHARNARGVILCACGKSPVRKWGMHRLSFNSRAGASYYGGVIRLGHTWGVN